MVLALRRVRKKTKDGIVTPRTWVADDSILKLDAQLAALAELLISKSILTRSALVAILDQHAVAIPANFFSGPLLDALFEKGRIADEEKEHSKGIEPQERRAAQQNGSASRAIAAVSPIPDE